MKLFLVLGLLTLTGYRVRALQCVNEEGKPVDWLVIYKLPREAGTKNKDKSFVNQGKVSEFKRAVSKLRITERGKRGSLVVTPEHLKKEGVRHFGLINILFVCPFTVCTHNF